MHISNALFVAAQSLFSHDECELQAKLSCFDLKLGDVCLIKPAEQNRRCASPPSKTNFPTVRLIHGSAKPVSSEFEIWWFFFAFFLNAAMQQFLKNPPLPLIPDIPTLSGYNWDINPMISILLFQQLFTTSTPIHTCYWLHVQVLERCGLRVYMSHTEPTPHHHATSWTALEQRNEKLTQSLILVQRFAYISIQLELAFRLELSWC